MGSKFKNSRDRLKRATDHAVAFKAEWDAIMQSDATRAELREEKGTGWHIIVAAPTPAAAERIARNTLSLELGEMAYQLRAALDGLMWDAVTYMQGTEPAADAANGLAFPILNGKERDFKKCGFHKFKFPQKLSDWIETIQPDSAEKPSGDPDRGLKVTLEDIHDLARMDRHRRLRTVAAIPISVTVSVATLPPGGKIVASEQIDCDLFSGQNVLARLKITCAGGLIPYHVRLKTNLAFDISLEDVEPYNGENVGVQFLRFFHAVERVISRFETEFT